MEIAIKLTQFLLSLSILIILHELGHFIPAKLFKTRVEKFYLFFDIKYSLLKKKIGETEYGIGWLPLGGYVKISGMIDESMDTEQMQQEPQPWEFRSKPAWQRLIIMLGGVTVNFILAFLIYIGMTFFYGEQYIANDQVKNGIWITNPVVEKAGLKTGDQLVSIDGEKVERFYESNEKLFLSKEIIVMRNGKEEKVHFPVNFIDQLMQGKKVSLVELRVPFIVADIQPDSQNKTILKTKDIITSFNGKPVAFADEVIKAVDTLKGQTIPVVVKRDGKEVPLTLKVNAEGKLGVAYAFRIPYDDIEKLGLYKVSKQEFGFFESIPVGIDKGFAQLANYGKQLKAIFNPKTGAYKGVGGFAAIFNIFPHTWSWEAFWGITALLSIMLGVMNLLPIPALDGGHVIFLLYEMISGKKPSDKFLEKAQMVGFILLIALLLFANGNDIYKAIFHK
ncbi:RIP metalloprotease RseP [Flavobacterium sp. XGLA_31]|uniref:RIP metalloprotease RseP n=1 Tax=Flavobacterium sp. XGLA_31 TaxID=3447666 RepID=UPI003F2F3A92